MATTRLRRTFHYPSDSDDPPDLDEEHQEELLNTLKAQDDATNTLYRHLFLGLPCLTSIIYLPSIFTSQSAADTFTALLSIASPALAAYVLYDHPILKPGRHGLRSLYVSSGKGGIVKPTERHLIVLGAMLAGMLATVAGQKWLGGRVEEAVWTVLPAVVFVLTMFVRQQLAPVDLEELRKARYELKGA
ncbi:hypothetical protein Q7P37_009172 [Cladosporium fusiforme]